MAGSVDFRFLVVIFIFEVVIFRFPVVIFCLTVVILCSAVVIFRWSPEVVVAGNGGQWWLEVAGGGTRMRMKIIYLKIKN